MSLIKLRLDISNSLSTNKTSNHMELLPPLIGNMPIPQFLSSSVLILESICHNNSKSLRKGSKKSSVRGTFQTKKPWHVTVKAFLLIAKRMK